jgi:hypothetical protein
MKIPYHNARRLEMCRAIVNTRTLMSCVRKKRLSGDRRRRGRASINNFPKQIFLDDTDGAH